MKLCVAAVLAAAVQAAATYPTYAIPSVDLSDATAGAAIVHELETTGIVALKNIPAFEATRLEYLAAAEQCVSTPHADVMLKKMVDGTERRTLSTNVDLSTLPASLHASCPDYVAALGRFNALLNGVTKQFAALLDVAAAGAKKDGDVLIEQIVDEGKHLEHYHAYTNPSTPVDQDSHEHSLEPHTDAGLGIFTSAPVFFKDHTVVANPDPSTGLYIQVRDAWVQPVLKSDELVFMTGEGWSAWLNTPLQFPAVVHAMKMPRDAPADVVRAFHGRMLLLKDDMVLKRSQLRFRDFADRNTRFLQAPFLDQNYPSIACASRPRMLLAASDPSCDLGIWAPGPSSAANTTADVCMFECNAVGHPEKAQKCKDLGCVQKSSVPNGGTECWMICVQKYTDAQCPSKAQTCQDQTLLCDGKKLAQGETAAPTTAAPAKASAATSAAASTLLVAVALVATM